MATTRINGVRYNIQQLTQYEIEALVEMAELRIQNAHNDLEKLNNELVRRGRC